MNFPHGSKDFLRLNNLPSGPKPKRPIRHKSLGKARRKEKNSTRCIVRITSFRRHLLDRGNLCAKYFVDSLRYAGAISDDSEKEIDETITQKQVETEEEEHTLIEVIYP